MSTVCANNNNNDPELNRILFWLCILAAAVLFAAVVSSCKTIQPTERVIIRTDTIRQQQRDSIFIHFTDTIREKQRGDTIYIENIKWRTAYKEFLRTDTIVRVDSISTHQVVVEARMNSLQSVFFWIGIILTTMLLLYIICKVTRWLK